MFVEGQNVRNISYMWEQMWRASIHYGRKGAPTGIGLISEPGSPVLSTEVG